MENKKIHAEDQLLLPKYCLNMDTNTLNKDEIIKTFYRKEICKQNFRKDRKGDNSMPHWHQIVDITCTLHIGISQILNEINEIKFMHEYILLIS